jgi:hypothetical protein
MSTPALIHLLRPFVGKHLMEVFDAIRIHADAHRYSVNIIDPEFNTGSIDENPRRLNIRTDRASVITSFTIG